MPDPKQLSGGLNAVITLLEADSETRVRAIWLQDNRRDKRFARIEQLARKQHIPITRLPRKALDAMLPDFRHQGVLAEIEGEKPVTEADIARLVLDADGDALVLVLDGVQDPHNLGACLRSAAGAGVTCVVVPRDRAVGLTPVVRKVASGAAEIVPLVAVTNLSRTLDDLAAAGLVCIGLDGSATQTLYQAHLDQPVALVMGAEGEGLRRLTMERCQQVVKIPLQPTMESLNVSVATGISLFEAVRQRMPGD